MPHHHFKISNLAWVNYDLNSTSFGRTSLQQFSTGSNQTLQCLPSQQNLLYQLYDLGYVVQCGKSEIAVVTPASSNTGLSSSNIVKAQVVLVWVVQIQMVGAGMVEQPIKRFQRTRMNQSAYGCYGAGHLKHIGVFINGDSQYTSSDITGQLDLQYQLLFDQPIVLHSIIDLSDESNKHSSKNEHHLTWGLCPHSLN